MCQQVVITEWGTTLPMYKRKSVRYRLRPQKPVTMLIFVRMTSFTKEELTCSSWDIQFGFNLSPSLDTIVVLVCPVVLKVSNIKIILICYHTVKISLKTWRWIIRLIESSYYWQRDTGRFLLLLKGNLHLLMGFIREREWRQIATTF